MAINKFLKDSRGFNLIGVMVAVAIVSFVALALTQVFDFSQKGMKTVQNQQSVFNLQMAAFSFLSDQAICTRNFQNVNMAAGGRINVPTVVNQDGSQTLLDTAVGTLYEYGSIKINRMGFNLNDPRYGFKAYAAAAPNSFRGAVSFVIEMSGFGGMGAAVLVRSINLQVELNGFSGAPGVATGIKSCVAVGNDFGQIWKYTTPAQTDIYYGAFPLLGPGRFKVGINTNAPASDLHVNGDIRADGNMFAGAFFYLASDQSLKEDIHTTYGLSLVRRLRGVDFKWKQNQSLSSGVIAQEVESVLPQAVFTDPVTGKKSVAYNQIIGPLIESTKELAEQNEELRLQLQDTRNQIQELKSMMLKSGR